MDWNNINRDRDTSGLGPIEYDQSKVPALIRKHADNVRTKTYGLEVREAQARNAEYAGLISSESMSLASNANLISKDTQNRFKDQIEGTTNSDEVIDARRPTNGVAFSTLNERIEAQVQHVTYAMFGVNADKKYFNPNDGKYYLDEEFTNEYDHNDGIEIKQAHEYANANGLPVKVSSGDFLIKGRNFIPIETNVDFGMSTFHIAEDDFTTYSQPFTVKSAHTWGTVQLTETFTMKKGQKRISELKQYAGHLALITDNSRYEGYRNGNTDLGNKVRDLIYIENGGYIIGELTHDYTSANVTIEVREVDKKRLTISGGEFLWNGRTGVNVGDDYISCVGFAVERDRVKIKNQAIKYEDGAIHNEVSWANGFYTPNKVYDFRIEDTIISPRNRVNNGVSYAISGLLVIDYRIENVSGLGDVDYWGSMGTNEITNLTIVGSKIKRIDTHYHLWNLTIRDSETQAIKATGGGEMIIENTNVISTDEDATRSFIYFRDDYGSTWDGNVTINDSKLIVSGNDDLRIRLLTFQPTTADYGYPIVFARKVKVNNFDFVFDNIENDSAILLYDISGGRTFGEHRLVIPDHIEMTNIDVVGRDKGVVLISTGTVNLAKTSTENKRINVSDNDVNIKPNAKWIFNNVYTSRSEDTSTTEGIARHLNIYQTGSHVWDDLSVVPEIHIINCKELNISTSALICKFYIKDSSVNRINALSRNNITFENVELRPYYNGNSGELFVNAQQSEVSYVNCKIYPFYHISGTKNLGWTLNRMGLFNSDTGGFMKVAPASHIGTKLTKEVIDYIPTVMAQTDMDGFNNHLRTSHMLANYQWTNYSK